MAEQILTIKSSAQLDREDLAAIEKGKQGKIPYVTKLAEYVKNAFQDAVTHRTKNGVSDRMMHSRRLKQGVYETDELNAIEQKGGSKLFHNITETKCEALQALLGDVFGQIQDRAWDASPTPIPSLDDSTSEDVIRLTVEQFAGNPEATPEQVTEFANNLYDETLKVEIEDAKEKCARMVTVMDDQTTEGGFLDALNDFIADLSVYPSAIMKGPVLVSKKRMAWVNGEISVTQKTIPTWSCVDPTTFYPAPNARTIDEGYVCEVVTFDKRALSELREVDGWKDTAIDAVIGAKRQGKSGIAAAGGLDPNISTDKADLEDRETSTNGGIASSSVSGVEFWGSVQGKMLSAWGMKDGIDDQNKYYEVNCVMVGDLILKAVLNPDPLGRRPYYVTSFMPNKNSVWGTKSVPEKMADCQQGVNGAQRNMMNNLALSSGPQVAVDIDAVPAAYMSQIAKIFPWKVWPYHGKEVGPGRKPMDFFQPNSNVQELLAVSEYYENKSDERTLIPRYTYGDNDLGGAGSTASGLSMMMNAANRGIKRIIKNVDLSIMRPMIERLYVWNMMFHEDDEIKGDVQVVPRGALAMLLREQTQLRRQEFLSMTNNPTDLQIVGIKGRSEILRAIAKGLDLDADAIVPPEEELLAMVNNDLEGQLPPELPAPAPGGGGGGNGQPYTEVGMQTANGSAGGREPAIPTPQMRDA